MTKYDAFRKWVSENFIKSERFNHNFPANDIKSEWEHINYIRDRDSDYYIDREEIGEILVDMGFKVFDRRSPYWVFNVDYESPAYQKWHERIYGSRR